MSVCLFTCMCMFVPSVLYCNDFTYGRADFWCTCFPWPILHWVLRELSYLQNEGSFVSKCCSRFWTLKFGTGTFTVSKCDKPANCWQYLVTVDGGQVMEAVKRQLPPVDHTQHPALYITWRAIWHDVGLSASADTCLSFLFYNHFQYFVFLHRKFRRVIVFSLSILSDNK